MTTLVEALGFLPRLGKHEARNDPGVKHFADYVFAGTEVPETYAAPAPVSFSWAHAIAQWTVALNNQLGDCVEAGGSHLLECTYANAHPGSQLSIPDPYVELAYEAFGYNPNAPLVNGQNPTDNGTDMTAFMSWFKNTGYPMPVSAEHPDGRAKILEFLSVNQNDPVEVRQAIYLGGGVLFGAQMPLAAQNMVNAWTAPPAGPLNGIWAPGSWGGHCTYSPSYTFNWYGVVSWGMWLYMMLGYANAYLDECFVAIPTDWIGSKGTAPNGFNIEKLEAALAVDVL